MQFHKRTSLAFKLVTLIVLTAGFFFSLTLIFNYYFLREKYIAKAREAAQYLARAKAEQFASILRGPEKVAETLAAIVSSRPHTEAELIRYLENAVLSNPEIFGSAIAFEPHKFNPDLYHFSPYVYRQDEKTVLTYLGSESYNYFNWRWYQVPKEFDRPIWSEPYTDITNDTVMITYSVPFYLEEEGKKKFQGVVTTDINLKRLQDLISSVAIFDQGYAFLLSREGVFVTVPKKEWIMDQNIFFVANIYDNPKLEEIGKRMLQGEKGFELIQDFIQTDRKAWLYFAPFPVGGFSMGVVIPEDELFADLNLLNQQLGVIALLGILFLAVVIFLVTRRVTRPLQLLERSAAAIAEGNIDAELPQPASRDEIGSLTHSFTEMQKALIEYIADLAATTAAKERIESELKIAHSIQMSFLPKRFPPLPAGEFVEIAALLEPAREVGGDLYDYFLVNDRYLFFMVGDVSDKGVPASLFMAVTKTLLKGLTEVGLEPSEIFSKVNRELAPDNDSMMFVTSFCGILDLETGELAYSNAGHNPPVLIRANQEPQWLPLPEGFFLGVFEETKYLTERIVLRPHDMILAYTDGVVEAVDLHHNLYSNERLLDTVNGLQDQSLEEMVQKVMTSVKTYSQGAPPADDITILAVRFKGYQGRK